MTSILSVIGSVDRRVESHRVAAKAAADSVVSPGPIIAAAAGPMQGVLGYGERLVRHSEQYKHNVGWTFTAVHRIATRMSDQPARVGRLLPPDASEYVRSWTKRHGFKVVDAAWRSRFGRRLLSPEDRALMPRRLKSAFGEYEIIENHEILDTLYNPNEIMTASTLCYVTVASFELTGKAYWWWSRQGGRLMVWHLPSDWVTPKHTDTAMYVSYDVKPPGYFADTITVPAEEITSFLLPDPSDPHKVVSPAQTQAPAIAADEAIQVAQARQFTNDMYPGLILKVGRLPGIDGKPGDRPILTRSQRKDLIEAARSVYEGSVNYREPFIVDGLIEGVERMTYTPAEMDYLQSGQSTKSRIMQSFGVNPFLSGENVTIGYAQASVAEDVFLANVINPLGRLMGEAVSKRLRLDGYVLWFEEAYPRNPELNLRKYALALTNPAGALVSEEEFRREVLQLPPREAKEEEREEPPSDGPGSEPLGGEIEEESRRLSLPAPAGKISKRAIAEYVKVLKRVRPEQAEVHERDMEKSMGRFFVKVARSIGKAMDDLSDEILLGGPSAAGLLYRAADWADEIKVAAGPPLVRAAVAGYETAKAMFEDRMADIKAIMPAAIKIAAGGWDPSEGTFLEGWELPATVRNAIDFGVTETLSQQYWQDILATTGDEVAGTLRTAMEEQWNRTDLKHQIMRDIGDTEGVRSRRIARTEMTGTMNMGHHAQAYELEHDYGLHPIRIWATVGDFLVRETHVAADGQQRPGMEKFEVGGYRCDFPGDWSLPAAERINCLVDPETPILIGPKFGKTKPIKDIQVGDLVLTHQGRFRRVARLAEEQTYSGVVHIITTDASELRLTPGHLVLTTRGWKPVEEIRPLDWVRAGLPVNQRSVRRSNDIRVALQHVLVSGASWEFVKGATLFNFAVDEDESYVASGVCLHNCRCAVLTDLQELREGGFTGETPALHGEEL